MPQHILCVVISYSRLRCAQIVLLMKNSVRIVMLLTVTVSLFSFNWIKNNSDIASEKSKGYLMTLFFQLSEDFSRNLASEILAGPLSPSTNYSMFMATCSGYADLVDPSSTGIGYSNGSDTAPTGAPDGEYAEVYDGSDMLVLDLTDEIEIGEDYILTWRRKSTYGSGGIADMIVEESADKITWNQNSVEPSTSSMSSFVMTTMTTENTTRYLRLSQVSGGGNDFDLDAVSYTNVQCGGGISGFPSGNLTCSAGSDEIEGTVFLDFNFDGIYDSGSDHAGLKGMSVTATDSLGNSFSEVTSSAGTFTFSGLTANRTYRVEFTFPDSLSWAGPTFRSGDNGTAVQFVQAGNCANLGVASPRDFCDNDNPPIIVSCYETGNAVYGATGNENKGIISLPYQSSGATPTGITGVADIYEVGTVWGLAWQPTTRRMFAATFLKRHSGLGPVGMGGIYVMDFTGSTGYITTSFDLQGVSPANGGASIDLGSVTRTPGDPDYELPDDNSTDNYDLDAYDKVGKTGFGDADLSENDSLLWLVNMNQRAIISVDVSDSTSYPGTVNQYPMSSMSGLPTCTDGVLRPWGLGIFRGKGYLGCVCSAENSGGDSDMHAYVFSFDQDDPTTMTQEVDYALDYTREKAVYFPGYSLDEDGDWHPWIDDWASTGYSNSASGELAYPQPVVSDIDFTEDGSMIIGMADRFGFQLGYRNYKPVSGETGQVTVDVAGDIIKFCRVDGDWVLEGGTGCAENDDTSKSSLGDDGPSGTGEFFYSDAFDDTGQTPTYNHNETFIGSLGVLRGTNEVVAAHYDPVDGNGYGFDLGLIWHNAATGARSDDFRIISSGPVSSKGNNLGDVAMVCSPPPLEIGNYVWLDEDSDGIQDAGEPGLEGVRMELYDSSGVLLAFDSTDINGEYYFSGENIDGATWLTSDDTLTALTMYYIVAGGGHYTGSGLSLGGNFYFLTSDSTDAGSNRYEIDSDGTIAMSIDPDFDGEPYVKITTKLLGQDDHTFDFGFSSCLPTTGDELYSGCEGDGYDVTVNGTLYNEASPTGTEILTNAAGCDSTVTINLVFNPASTGDETYVGCLGDGYSVTVNGTVYNIFNQSGTETLTDANGCDSIVTVDLTFHPNPVTDVIDTLCPGDSLVVNGTTYNEANPMGSEVFFGGSQYGCDSTVSVNLSFYPTALNSVIENHCDGDGYSITLNSVLYNQANPTGIDTIFGGSSMGCDSIINVDLSFHPETSSSIIEDRCSGDGYSVTVNGTVYDEGNQDGVEVIPNANGCDSTITIDLTFKPTSVGSETYTGCSGDPYAVTVNGTLYNEANPSGIEVLTNSVGCDSTVTINLVFNPNSNESESYNGCEGDGYAVTVNGTLYNEANPTGTEVLTNQYGCDSTVTINLVYNVNLTGNEDYTGCESDGYSVTVNGTLYNEANPTGMETLTSSIGCDSIVTINLVYNAHSTGNEDYTGCEGDGYNVTVNGTLYNEANPTGTEVLTNAEGCDSTVTINLVYNAHSTGDEQYTGCEGDGYNVTVNGTLYNEANPTGTEVLTNAEGCDSTVTINLVYNAHSTGDEQYTGCEGDGYNVTVNGTLYNEANPTGTEVLTNAEGCDSTVTINLVYNAHSTGDELYTGCEGDGYNVTVNGTLYNEANPTGTEVLTNAEGCDSTVTINLVYNAHSTGDETYTGCEGDGYNVTVNGTLYNEANPTGTEVLTNAEGCDSTVTINLVYNAHSTGDETYTGCEGDGYNVTVNGTLYNEANPTGTEVLTNAEGCDSTVTINLVYNAHSTGDETYTGCEGDGYNVTVNGTLYNEANPTGTEILTNAEGCDSTVTINLVYNAHSTGDETYTGCEGDGYNVTVKGTLYNEANPTGTEVLTNAEGCDSTVTINLVYNAHSTGDETYTGCEGDGYNVTVNGTLYNEANPTGTEVLTNAEGCDSTVTINLVYNAHSTGDETYTGCEGDGYNVTVNGTLYNEANPTGTEILTNAEGCDSTVSINLVYNAPSTGDETYTGCDGDGYSVTVNGTLYNEANPTGTEVLTNAEGCDSTVTINLVFNTNLTGNEDYIGCEGDGYSITVNGTLYNEANPAGMETLTSSLGCDSVVTVNLVYNAHSTGDETYTGCEGDGYNVTVNGTLYNEANPTGTEVLANAEGCDSTVTVNLVYNAHSTGDETYTGCEGDGYNVTVNGTLYNEANPAGTEVLTNAEGCDSTVTVNLVYNAHSTGDETYTGCEGDGYNVTVNGTLYNEANPTGTEVLTNAEGCDSTVTINLVYNAHSTGDETYTGCEGDGYNVTVNGTLYNEANPIGTEVLTNAEGCDSTITINLVYNAHSTGDETYTGCEGDGYNVTVNGTLYNEANPTGTEVLTNAEGCDSTVTINLVYNATSTGDETYTGCEGDGYNVTVNGTLYNEANPTGTEILTNAEGCDSTVTINLVYYPNPVNDLNETLCTGSSIFVNGTEYNEANPTGTEVVVGGSQFGCDSTINVNLTFNSFATNSIVEDHCVGDGYSVTVNGTLYNEANPTGTETIPNGSYLGCDSIITVDLSFLPNTTGDELYLGCTGDGYSVTVNGTLYNEANPTGTEVLVNQYNCDSTVTINLVYENISSGDETYTGCSGDGYSVTVNSTLYNEANPTGTEVLTNSVNCDSTVTINLVFNPTSTGDETYTGCAGDGYSVTVNGTLYNEANSTGTEVLTNAIGCDSTVTINLVFNPNTTGNEDYLGCTGDGYSVTVNGTLYNEGNPTGTEVLLNQYSCDSTVTINLVYENISTGDETYTGCTGDGYSVTVNGTLYNEANPTGTEVLTNSVNCDSTVTINLVFNPTSTGDETYTGCTGDGYSVTVNGTLYNEANPSGTEDLTNAIGCDSTVTINLVFNPNTTGNEDYLGCTGDGYSVTVNGTLYNEANPTGTELQSNQYGCDSTVTVNLVFNPTSIGSETYTGCAGDGYSVTVNGTVYDEANPTGVEVLPNQYGCDSTVTIDFTFYPNPIKNITETLCTGGSLTVNGTVYNEANPTGVEVVTGGSQHGCDSTINVNLMFNSFATSSIIEDHCEGDGYSVTVNGTLYNEANPSGMETIPMGSYLGCDSIITVDLSFLPNSTSLLQEDRCAGDGYSVTVNGTLYNEANPTGTEVLVNSVGCDSTVTIDLVFNPTSTVDETYAGCAGDGYSVTVNGTLYNEANPTGTEVLSNQYGCDSTVNVNLVYNPTSTSDETYTGCTGDGYSVTVNGTIYNEANPTGTEVLTNQYGCDSTVTVNLVFNPISSSDELYTGCTSDGYSVTVNGTLYNEANPTGTEVLSNQYGCDSTITINLVYENISVGSETYTGCTGDGYSVTVNGTLYNEANPTGTEVLTNSVNCDSTVTINLVFNPTSTGDELYTGCAGDAYSVTVNGTLYNEANPSGTEVLSNQYGCDSTVTVNLVYNPTSTGDETYTGCEGDGYSVTVNGTLYNEANPTGSEVLTNQYGCDSTITVNLVFNPNTSGDETYTGCDGDGYSVTVNGTLYNEANPTGTEVLTNAAGCDSTVTINLVYNLNTTGDETYTGCEGDGYSVTVNGTLYNEANPSGTEVLTNAVGCDSTVTINLVFNPNSTGDETYTGCEGDGYSVIVNGTLYNESNPTGTEVLTNAVGCDSTVSINLIYNLNSTGEETYSGCEGDGYSVTVNGTLYNESNPTGTEVLTNAIGCDSTVTINLVYNPNSIGEESYYGCEDDGYSVTVNGTLYNESNPTGTEVLTNAVGCDSTVTINLIFDPNSESTIVDFICEDEPYFHDGVQYFTTGIYEVDYTAANGCDSTVTLDLTLQTITELELTDTLCPDSVYYFYGEILNAGGTYYDTLYYVGSGCDSVHATLNLIEYNNCTEEFDLALRKTLGDGQANIVYDGDTVTFKVYVFNQGNVDAYNVVVLDYETIGLDFDADLSTGWVDFGGGPAWVIPYLPEGGSDSLTISFIANEDAGTGYIANYAEIVIADNDTDDTNPYPIDEDSTPNADVNDDPGGDPDTPADDEIDGDGTGAPGSNDPETDEDDHDGSQVFFIVKDLSLGNLVFHDKDNDGIFNNADEGIDGVEVELYDVGPDGEKGTMDDSLVDTKTTNTNGNYLFTELDEGLYYVKLNGNGIPAGYNSSTGDGFADMDGAGPYEPYTDTDNNIDNEDDGSQMGAMVMSDTIRLVFGDEPTGTFDNENLTVDFGLYEVPILRLGNQVFEDKDNDGIFNNDDEGIANVEVELYDVGPDEMKGTMDDVLVDTQITDSLGMYQFTNLMEGLYYVKLNGNGIPADFVSSTGEGPTDFDGAGPYEPTSGTDDNVDYEDDGSQMGAMVMSDTIRMSVGEEPEDGGNTNNTVDFGLYEPNIDASLGDYVWYDDDVDGQQDSTEVGVPNIDVYLFDLGLDGMKGGGDDNQVGFTTTDSVGYYFFGELTPGSYYVQFDLGTIPTDFYPTTTNDGDDATDSDANGMGMTEVVTLAPTEHNPTIDMGIYDPMFDLALYKDLAPGQSNLVDLGQDVRYHIRVENEGLTTAYNVEITDHIPAGLILSPTDSLWTLVNDSTATYEIPTPIPPAGDVTVEIILAVQYGASGASLVNFAEVTSATDKNGIEVDDIDSTPDNEDPMEDDIDDEEIVLLDHDPTGWIYCEKTGDIISGGTITVVGPNGIPNDEVVMISDGTNGYYEFFAVGLAGTYTIQYSHPSGYPLSVDCPPGDTLDPTGLMPPVVLGSTESGGYLSDYSCIANPYYFHFDLDFGDPAIFANNIPIQCSFIRSVVCDDANNNDSIDVADTPVPNVTVYLYDCADQLNPIDSTISDAQGRYVFGDLFPGNYMVGFNLTAGERFVSNGNINQNGLSDCINLGWGECDTSKVICIYQCPPVSANDATICYGEAAQLLATTPYGNGSYQWSPGATLDNAFIANPMASPLVTTGYTVTYDDGFGCIDTDSITVFVRNTTPFIVYTPFIDVTIECTDPIPFDAPTFADSCDQVLDITLDSLITNNVCGYTIERTWTATNDQGNFSTFVQTVTIIDTAPPSMTASHPILGTILHGNTYYADCMDIPSLDSLGFAANDLCSGTIITFDENVTPGNCITDGFIESRYCGWTATDSCGNTDSLFFTIIVTDTVAPVLNGIPVDTAVDCSNIPPVANVTAIDNCIANPTLVFDEMTWGDSINGCYIIMRTWTATDSCGNSNSASQTIQVTDNEPPVLVNVPPNATGGCDDPTPVVTAVDNCDTDVEIVLTEIVTADSTGCVTQVLQTWTATDDCGNQAIASRTLIVDSNLSPPVISVIHPMMAGVQDGDVLYLECQDIVSLSADDATASADCCGMPTIEFHEYVSVGNCQTDGYWQLMQCGWTATDCCGNMDSLFFTVYIIDNTPPDLYGVPADMDYSCAGDVPMPITVFAVDNCYGVGPVTFAETDTLINGFETIIRTWSVSDLCGNTQDSSQVITLTQQMAPFILNVPADTLVYRPIDVPSPSAQVIAVDSCDMDPMLVVEDSITGNDCCYVINRTWTATNDAGMSSTATQIITVLDTLAPVLSGIPDDITVECEYVELVVPPVTAFDSCTVNPLLELTLDTIFNACGIEITRTWTATDDCGNSISESQIITVQDTVAPVITGVPDDITVECEYIELVVSPVMVYDSCTINPLLELTLDTTFFTCGIEILRTWTATDDCGNSTSASQTITVLDTLAPEMEANHFYFGDIFHGDTLYADCSQIPTLDSIGFGATDNCGGNVNITFDEIVTTGDCATDGFVEWRYCGWTATDECGNTDSLFFTVIVSDTTAPVLTGVPGDATVDCNSVPTVDSLVTASDNCTSNLVIDFVENQTSYTCVGTYTLERTWSATDSCGNTTSVTQIINVLDTVPPSMSANHPDFGDIFHGDVFSADCSQIPSLDSLGFTAMDDCSDVEIAFYEAVTEGNCLIDGFIESRYCGWTATDSCGNSDSLFFTIIVSDTVAPELIGVPADITLECDDVLPTDSLVTATDACFGVADVTMTRDSIPGGCIGTYTIESTWTATDSCGNTTSATQVITVENTTPPMMQANHPVYGDIFDGDTLYADCAQIASLDSVTFFAFDACCDVNTSFSSNVSAGNCAVDGYIELRNVGWVSTDCCGNSDSLFYTVIVIDTIAPELIGVPANVTVECDEAFPSDSLVTAIDACFGTADVTMTRDSFPGVCVGTYTIENTWTATDSCGNTSSATQVITVDNTTPPVMEASHAFFGQIFHGDTLYADCTQIPSLDSLGFFAYDPCCDVTTTFTEMVTTGDCDVDGYVESRYCGWTATDCCGNADSLFFTVIVQDMTAPELFGVPNDTIVLCDSIPAATGPTAFDLCDSIPIVYAIDSLSSVDCPYTITRVWYAEDACGNITTDTQYIEAVERFYVDIQFVNPDLIGLQDGDTLIVDCSDPDAFELNDAEATTNCGQSIDFTFEENFVAYGDCPQDHFIALLSNTWMASACGADTSLTVFLLFVDSVGPTFDYTPSDTTISCSDVVPAFGTPIATDACGAVSLTNIDSTIVTGNGQDLLRIWTATDDCGNEAYFTQTIHVEGGIMPELESISVSPEVCDGADGAVVVLVDGDEANFDYSWIPDVGMDNTPEGNSRVGLTAGDYEVVISNGGCSDTFQFTIKDECGCEPATVDSLSILESTCGVSDGAAEIFLEGDMTEYAFTWIPNIGTPNTLDNGRTDLPAGHYVVIMVHNGDNSCVVSLEFDIYDDCNRCGPVFEIAGLSAFVDNDPAIVCLPVPFGVAIGMDISINGQPFMGAINECELQDVTAYSYSAVPGMAQDGPFHIMWEHDGIVFSTVVENMDQLAAGMSQVDNNSDWYNDKKAFQLISKNLGGDYGNMYVYTIPTGAQTAIDPITGESELGTYIELPLGVNEIEFTNADNSCSDVMTATLEMTQDAGLFQQDTLFINGPCQDEVYDYCFEIPAYLFDQFYFTLNGQSIDDQLEVCSYKEVIYYTYATMAANQPPYEVQSWSVNGGQHTAIFNTFDELVDLLNSWDPSGTWILNTNSLSIEGGDLSNNYSSLKLRHPASGQIVDLAVNTLMTIDQYGLQIQPGIYNLTGTNFTGGASDNLTLLIACTTVDYQSVTTSVGAIDTVCFASNELLGSTIGEIELCNTSVNDNASIEAIPGTNCLEVQGLGFGNDQTCVVICDEYGFCDTTYLRVRVLPKKQGPPDSPEIDPDMLIVHNGFSPNGDGINDYFSIEGLEMAPDHTLTIFDRFGKRVMSTKNYQNDWGGSWGQEDVKDGTYYYILELKGGKRKSGYIQILR